MEGEHEDSVNRDEQGILEEALSTAFSPPPFPRPHLDDTTKEQDNNPATSPEATFEATNSVNEDIWKEEYETYVKSWRARSAEAREKAEKERARWEAIRATQREQAVSAGSLGDTNTDPGLTISPDARDLIAGESHKHEVRSEPLMERLDTPPVLSSSILLPRTTHSRQQTTDESQKWEEIPSSLTSSFPSMSFPEPTESSSPARKQAGSQQTPTLTSVTVSIFDSSLSKSTRVKALLSSLAINLLLPFINGVMLGFGEIFAKEVVMKWFGWKRPSRTGRIATTTGISNSKQRNKDM